MQQSCSFGSVQHGSRVQTAPVAYDNYRRSSHSCQPTQAILGYTALGQGSRLQAGQRSSRSRGRKLLTLTRALTPVRESTFETEVLKVNPKVQTENVLLHSPQSTLVRWV